MPPGSLSMNAHPRPTAPTSPNKMRNDDERWTAVCKRDSSADDLFVYAVRTTGIYCRPSCAARRPLRRNVAFFASGEAARAAGYRACLRCRPDATHPHSHVGAAIERACLAMREAETSPRLVELARLAGMSPSHFHRVFTATVGITPKAYASSVRAERGRRTLRTAATVTTALHDAGYESHSSFYGDRVKRLGMPPSRYRTGGTGESIRFAIAPCWLGHVLAAATAKGVCAILLGDDARSLSAELARIFPSAHLEGPDRGLAGLLESVVQLVACPARHIDLPLDIRGTAFQRRVWDALIAVPSGSTTTYAELARQIGAPKAVRAVGHACASNTLAVAVPCHRALRSDGTIAGYRWDPRRKRALLDAEREGRTDGNWADRDRVD